MSSLGTSSSQESSAPVVARRSLLQAHALPAGDIEARSFEIISGLVPPLSLSYGESQTVKRVIHTTGDPSILSQIAFSAGAIEAGVAAIWLAAAIFTDVKMAAAGINRPLASSFGCAVRCLIDGPSVADLARQQNTTRTAAGVLCAADQLGGAIVAIGNAPTALLALLDLVDEGRCRPALVVGTPVGFVGAAESKAELVRRDVPYVTITGTRGGSTIAAATVNALLLLAAAERRRQE